MRSGHRTVVALIFVDNDIVGPAAGPTLDAKHRRALLPLYRRARREARLTTCWLNGCTRPRTSNCCLSPCQRASNVPRACLRPRTEKVGRRVVPLQGP